MRIKSKVKVKVIHPSLCTQTLDSKRMSCPTLGLPNHEQQSSVTTPCRITASHLGQLEKSTSRRRLLCSPPTSPNLFLNPPGTENRVRSLLDRFLERLNRFYNSKLDSPLSHRPVPLKVSSTRCASSCNKETAEDTWLSHADKRSGT